MSNSRWRIVGIRVDEIPYSNSAHESEEAGRAYAERQAHSGFTPLAIMPEDESVMVADTWKPEKLMQNMEKVLHSHPEWFFDDQSEDRYMEWRRKNGYASAGQTITVGPRKPKPQICPEVWREKPKVDKTDYMAAVRSMCGESGKGE